MVHKIWKNTCNENIRIIVASLPNVEKFSFVFIVLNCITHLFRRIIITIITTKYFRTSSNAIPFVSLYCLKASYKLSHSLGYRREPRNVQPIEQRSYTESQLGMQCHNVHSHG
jgi:hypothetical protein